MALSTAGRNAAVDGLATAATTVSLHTADPGLIGANEVTGGTPAYARKTITWAAASAGARAMSGTVLFDVPAGVTVSHFGLWNGTTFLGGDVLRDGSNNPQTSTFSGQGTYTLNTATLTIN